MARLWVVLLGVAVFGCDAPTTSDAGMVVAWGNSADLLSGPPVGAKQAPNQSLSKTVAVQATGDSRFQVIAATLSREKATEEDGFLVVRVRNVGATGACFVGTENLVYRGTMGTWDSGVAFVEGSVQVRFSLATNTCLGPGEDGFVTDLIPITDGGTFYSGFDSIEFVWTTRDPGTRPSTQLIPVSYELITSGVNVVVKNTGSATAKDELGFGTGVLLESDLTPRGFFLVFPATSEFVLNAGATVQEHGLTLFEGNAPRLYVNAGEFTDCPTCLQTSFVVPRTNAERAALLERVTDFREGQRERWR